MRSLRWPAGWTGPWSLPGTHSSKLAIVDVNLNGEKTYPVAEILTARDIPFIFATGYGAPVLDEKWRHLPALQKPFQAQELIDAIAAMRRRPAPTAAGGPQG